MGEFQRLPGWFGATSYGRNLLEFEGSKPLPGWFGAYLIFVSDAPTVSVEKKSVMWRNFRFQYMTDV